MDIGVLAAELAADPLALGYATMDATQAAAALNLVRDGTPGKEPLIQIRRTDIRAIELMNAIQRADLKANPTSLEGALLTAYLLQPTITITDSSGNDSVVKNNIDQMLTNGSPSRTAVNALRFRFISRAEQLTLGRVEPGHEIEARAFGG